MRERGVTLIELVVVMAILAAVSVGIANFVRTSVDSVIGISGREQLLSASRFAIDRIRLELTRAIPNSVRIRKTANEHCIQFVPFNWASVYLDLPMSGSADFTAALPIIAPETIDGTPYVVQPITDIAIVYPLRPEDIYESATQSNEFRKVRIINGCQGGACNVFTGNTLTLQLSNGFPESSPAEKLYIASQSTNFCVFNNTLLRFDSPILPTQPVSGGVGDLLANNIINELVAGDDTVSNQDDPFQVFDASRLRSATVQVRLRYTQNNEQVAFQQEVHIPNAP